MTLSTLDILNGAMSLFVVGISLYVGTKILLRYFTIEKKQRTFILVGLVGIITSEPWWPHSISFLMALTTGTTLDTVTYFVIGNTLIPIAIFLWLMAISDFLYKEKQKLILKIGIIYVVVFEVVFFALLRLNPSLIGEKLGDINVHYGPIMLILLISALSIILPTGLIFARVSMKSESDEVRMKGKFLALAFISYNLGAAIDALIVSNYLTLPLARVLLSLAAIGFYGGFIPAEWMKKLLIK